jgi:putative serine protease PepD
VHNGRVNEQEPGRSDAWLPPLAEPESPTRRETSGGGLASWVWPAIASLALLVGVGGGLGGSVLYRHVLGEDVVVNSPVVNVDPAPIANANASIVKVANAVLPSTVSITAEYGGHAAGATGSGFVFDDQGHVITNNHVVASAAADNGPIRVTDQAGDTFKATIVGRSPVYDIAVLDVPGVMSVKPASLGTAVPLRVGETVVAIGSPLGLDATVTSGIVSALDRPVTTRPDDGSDALSYINAVQTDAAINPGNSGGPLVNIVGQVVGVNSAIATAGYSTGQTGNIGVGFAIPIDQVKITAVEILKTGRARYPVIGAQVQAGRQSAIGKGATLESVESGTPAAKAGLRSGDVITQIDGARVTDGVSLIVDIRTHQPGQKVDLLVDRGGHQLHVTVTLGGEVG